MAFWDERGNTCEIVVDREDESVSVSVQDWDTGDRSAYILTDDPATLRKVADALNKMADGLAANG